MANYTGSATTTIADNGMATCSGTGKKSTSEHTKDMKDPNRAIRSSFEQIKKHVNKLTRVMSMKFK